MLKQTLINQFIATVPEDYRLIKEEKVTFENDEQNQAIETIDVLHFGASILMYLKTKEEILKLNEEIQDNELEINPETPISDILRSKSKLILGALENDFVEVTYSLMELLVAMSNGCNRNLNDIYNGYFKKNELNAKRVDSGYMTGEYKKLDENGNEDNRNLQV